MDREETLSRVYLIAFGIVTLPFVLIGFVANLAFSGLYCGWAHSENAFFHAMKSIKASRDKIDPGNF